MATTRALGASIVGRSAAIGDTASGGGGGGGVGGGAGMTGTLFNAVGGDSGVGAGAGVIGTSFTSGACGSKPNSLRQKPAPQ